MPDIIYLAVFKGENYTLELEYIPDADGTIEIVSAHLTERARTAFETRARTRRRGLTLSDQDETAEAMTPYLRAEILR